MLSETVVEWTRKWKEGGILEGEKKGRKEGQRNGLRKAARRMIEQGMDREAVLGALGLSESELEEG